MREPPYEVYGAFNIAVGEQLRPFVGEQSVLESNEFTSISSHVGAIEVSSQGRIVARLRESIDKINIVKSQTTAICLLAVDDRSQLILPGTGGDAIVELDYDLILREVIGEVRGSS